jgi:succinoglycan biosynthesis transport protein ExoP
MQISSANTDALLNENIIDLRYYWKIMLKNKWWILACAMAAAGLSIAVTSAIKPVYRSTTTVMIESSENKVVSIEDVYGMNTHAKEYFLTQFELLKSRELLSSLVTKLNLVENPEFDPRQQSAIDWRSWIPGQLDAVKDMLPKAVDPASLSATALHNMVLAQVQESLKVEMVANTQLVKINFDANDPALAAQVANTLADLYIERNMESRLEMTQKAAGWLSGRLEGLSAKLKESEAKLQAYREQNTLVEISGVNTLNAEELTELTQRFVAASDERSKAQNALEQVRGAISLDDMDRLLEIPAIQSHDLVKSLKREQVQAELKVAELSKHYGPRHPKMISARAEVDQAKAELDKQIMWVARGIESDYRKAQETERAISGQLNMAKRDAQSVNRKEFRLSELQREVETNRQLYDMFMTRAKETGETGGLQPAHARVVDKATPGSLPVFPNTKLFVALAIMLGLSAGVVLSFVRDALDTTIKTPEELEARLRMPLLGTLPKTRTRSGKQPYEGFLSARFSSFAESVRSLRSSLIVANMEKPY